VDPTEKDKRWDELSPGWFAPFWQWRREAWAAMGDWCRLAPELTLPIIEAQHIFIRVCTSVAIPWMGPARTTAKKLWEPSPVERSFRHFLPGSRPLPPIGRAAPSPWGRPLLSPILAVAKFTDELRPIRQPNWKQQRLVTAIEAESIQRKVLDDFHADERRQLLAAGFLILVGALSFALARVTLDMLLPPPSRGRPAQAKPKHEFTKAAALEMLVAARWLYGKGQEPDRPISVLASAIAEEEFAQSSVRNLRETLVSVILYH
jgi:hypothetical protein